MKYRVKYGGTIETANGDIANIRDVATVSAENIAELKIRAKNAIVQRAMTMGATYISVAVESVIKVEETELLTEPRDFRFYIDPKVDIETDLMV